jgi:cytoskeletal protein RodZ
MFDLATIFILMFTLVFAGILLWFWYRDTELEEKMSAEPEPVVASEPEPVVASEPEPEAAAEPTKQPRAKRPRANAANQSHPAGEVTPTQKVAKPSSRVRALKSTDAVSDVSVPVIAPPTKTTNGTHDQRKSGTGSQKVWYRTGSQTHQSWYDHSIFDGSESQQVTQIRELGPGSSFLSYLKTWGKNSCTGFL